ncbi:MAG: rhodanese-like domain-containing protein [Pseudomonadota bacterium]
MEKNVFRTYLPTLLLSALLFTGCNTGAGSSTSATDSAVPVTSVTSAAPAGKSAEVNKNKYVGKVVGKSNKAKQISIETGEGKDAKSIMLSFDDTTIGLEHAEVGHASIIIYEMRGDKPFAKEIKQKLAKLPEGSSEIKIDELKALVDKGEGFVLVDSRPGPRYSEAHLPNAISIPVCEMQELLQNLPSNKDKLLIFYCGGPTCGMSTKSAGQAVKAGYKNVRVFLGGVPGWAKAEYPLYANYGWVCRGNTVIIDLRSTEADAEDRIPRSVSMPFATFKDTYSKIPKKAPVVLYGDNEEQAIAAMKILKEDGYKKISLVEGGFQGWKRVGGSLVRGPVETKPLWVRTLSEGEVTKSDFEAALADSTKAVILDVRTRDEVKGGKFPQAQHIPLDELCKEMDNFICKIKDVSRGQKIYIHCTTGARAEMAYKELKKRGYNVFYLVGEVDCQGDKCTITE